MTSCGNWRSLIWAFMFIIPTAVAQEWLLQTSSISLQTRNGSYNSHLVNRDIKFTRQGFENACWHRKACRGIQHAFLKLSLVNFISKDVNLVFYLSAYQVDSLLKLASMTQWSIFCVDSASLATSFKKATSSWPDKGKCREIDNVYQATCNAAVNLNGN